MKIIFLDIDGVLNSHDYWIRCPDRDHSMAGQLDPLAIQELNRIVEQTGASIVITSTWRKIYTIEQIKNMFASKGYKYNNIIDMTENLNKERGSEIDKYLKSKNFSPVFLDKERCEEIVATSSIENYIIIDDDNDFLYNQRNNIVLTTMKHGLTSEIANKCISLLNKKFIDLYY